VQGPDLGSAGWLGWPCPRGYISESQCPPKFEAGNRLCRTAAGRSHRRQNPHLCRKGKQRHAGVRSVSCNRTESKREVAQWKIGTNIMYWLGGLLAEPASPSPIPQPMQSFSPHLRSFTVSKAGGHLKICSCARWPVVSRLRFTPSPDTRSLNTQIWKQKWRA